MARRMLVPAALAPLIAAICADFQPSAIYLFGSRARNDHRDDSDWDLMVALPNDAPDRLLDPMTGWQLQREVGIPATILTARLKDLAECWEVPNTIGFVVAREGRLLDI